MSESPLTIVPRIRGRSVLERRDWDAIVIGSGVGSLTCAAFLAQAGKRVLVLERHYELGGLSQTFRRRRFRFEVGVHYVGSVGAGSLLRRMFDVATDGRLAWAPLPERHDWLRAPGIDLRFGGGLAAWREQLAAAAPGEQAAIDRVLEEIALVAREAPRYFLERAHGTSERALSRHPLRSLAAPTTIERLHALGCSPHLADLFTYAWGDYGLRREESSFAQHAITFAHYLGGAFHPIGGGRAVGRALASSVTRREGAIVVRGGVRAVIERAGAVAGVVLDDGFEVCAPLVISGVGAAGTAALLGDRGAELAAIARSLGPSEPHVGLYLGLAGGPVVHGLDGTNRWIGRDGLVTFEPDVAAWLRGQAGEVPGLYVSTASALDALDPSSRAETSTLVATISVPRHVARELGSADQAEHAAIRDRLARGMLRLLERELPGLSDRVVWQEISVPRTTTRFTSHPSGEAYGLAATPARFVADLRPRIASLGGMYLTGQDTFVSGVAGAAAAGLFTATSILGRSPM